MHTKSRIQNARHSALENTVHREADKSFKPISKPVTLGWTVAVLGLGVGLLVWYFRVDHAGRISHWIQSFGVYGVALSILLMALFCVIPVPSEFLMVMNMKIFGVWWGILYTWAGAMIGAVAVFFIARYFGSRIVLSFVSQARFEQVGQWVGRRGAVGLLIARLIPLPFIVVNYAAGVVRSVKVRDYLWTTGLGLLPYDIGAALVFIGLSKRFVVWVIVGFIAVTGIWIGGYLYTQRASKSNSPLR